MQWLPRTQCLQTTLMNAKEELDETRRNLVDLEEKLGKCRTLGMETTTTPFVSSAPGSGTLPTRANPRSDELATPAQVFVELRPPDSPSESFSTWDAQLDGESFSMDDLDKSGRDDDDPSEDLDPSHGD